MRRRDLLAGMAIGPVFAQQAGPAPGQRPKLLETGVYPGSQLSHRLLGKRLVFTSWRYVEHSRFRWHNKQGKTLTLEDSLPPAEATLEHLDLARGIRLRAMKPRRAGPLLEPQADWEEGTGVVLTTVFKDGGMYRGWGMPFCTSGLPKGQFASYYLESHDGLSWTRPKLGLIEYRGSRQNNIVLPLDTRERKTSTVDPMFAGTVFIDSSAPASERYKLYGIGYTSHENFEAWRQRHPGQWVWSKGMSLRGALSSDGLRWNLLPDPLAVEYTDTHVVAYYDERLKKYVGYTRRSVDGRRSIARSETDDFRNFPAAEVIVEPGLELEPSESYYTNCRTCIPGAPDHHLMFPAIYHLASDTMSIGMLSSYDGRRWDTVPGSPVFEPGAFGEWDGGCIFAHPNLIELPNGDFALPYSGYSVPHKYPRGQWQFRPGMMIWPKGRLVALEAPQEGEFATVRLIPPGRKLRLNVLTKRAGKVVVEVARADTTPVPGRRFEDAAPIRGDHQAAVVTWGGEDDLGHAEGAEIFLRFRLDQAQIFALEFA
jgi:hypothetical protein